MATETLRRSQLRIRRLWPVRHNLFYRAVLRRAIKELRERG